MAPSRQQQNSNNILRIAPLVRMSLDVQENSPERQRGAFADYCVKWDLLPVGPVGGYADLGVSATHTAAADRLGLQAMLQDAKRRQFDLVFVEEISRSSRRSEEFFPLRAELRRLGIALVTKHDDPRQEYSAAARFAQGVMLLAAELEAGLLSERVRDTLRLKTSRGEYRGGNVAMGLRWAWDVRPSKSERGSGHWECADEAAAVVTKLYETYLQTRSLERTAEILNDADLRTNAGRLWSGSSVRSSLRAVNYRGQLRFGTELFPCPDIPEIIPKHLVAQVDAIIADAATRTMRCGTSPYAIFSGLLRCPLCDNWLSVHLVRKPSEKVHVSYYCWQARMEPRRCEWRRYMAQIGFERALLPALINHLQLHVNASPGNRRQQQQPKQATLRRQAQKLDLERQRVLQQHQRGWLGDSEVDTRLREIQRRRDDLQMSDDEPPIGVTKEQLLATLKALQEHWWHWTPPERRNVLQSFVEYIVPNRDNPAASHILFKR